MSKSDADSTPQNGQLQATFFGATPPRKLNQDNVDHECCNVRPRYETYILYSAPIRAKSKNGSNINKVYKKRIVMNGISKQWCTKKADMATEVLDSLVSKWTVDKEDKDRQFIEDNGAFLNPKFWSYNVLYNRLPTESIDAKFQQLTQQIRDNFPVAVLDRKKEEGECSQDTSEKEDIKMSTDAQAISTDDKDKPSADVSVPAVTEQQKQIDKGDKDKPSASETKRWTQGGDKKKEMK